MNTFIFLGPSLPVEQARQYLEAQYLPPVQQGDILKVLRHEPAAIGIVDGAIVEAASVWHKEILLALSRGVHVFGAGGLGALRAAELHRFGMVGIGRIFESYRTGELEDDDEIALTPGSEAMVNVRDALLDAVAADVIAPETAGRLVALAKRLFYPDRTYSRILELAGRELDAAQLEPLAAFLQTRRPSLQERDTIAMLRHMASFMSQPPPPLKVPYVVEHTVFLDALVKEIQ